MSTARMGGGDGRSKGKRPPTTEDTKRLSKMLPAAPPPLEVGAELGGRYLIEECVGEGGSGCVFRALDKVLGERVAVKVLRADIARDKKWIRRLGREVTVARAIRHPNVCRVFDFQRADGHWFVTMEFAEGGTLGEVLDKRSMVRPIKKVFPDSQRIDRLSDARAVCAGVAAIHAVAIVHRDITPGNVLRMKDGRLVITDFGLAIGTKDETTFHGGTPKYMAPEVRTGRPADQRSDVWQLGFLLHEILFAKHPQWTHVGERVALKSPARDDADAVDLEMAALCAACLSHNPEARPPSAVIVAGRLAAAEHARPLGAAARAWMRTKRVAHKRWVWGPLAGVVLAAAATLGVLVLSRPTLCKTGASRASAVWNGAVERSALTAFRASLRPGAEESFALVAAGMRDHIAHWISAQTETCRETTSPEVLDLRLACLEEDLEGISALADIFTSGIGEVVDEGPRTVALLKGVNRCADIRGLRAGVPPPKDARVRKNVEDIRREAARAQALSDAGQYDRALKLADPLVGRAEATGYCPVIAETLVTRAYANVVDTPAEHDLFERAFLTAETCGHDRVVAMASAALVYADRFDTTGKWQHWAAMGSAVLERMGGDRKVEAWILNNESIAAKYGGRYDDAIEYAQKAIGLYQTTPGSNELDVGIGLISLSDALKEGGRLQEALEANDRALSIVIKWTGHDHFLAGATISNRGDLLVALRRFREAESAYRDALKILGSQLPPNEVVLAYPTGGLGVAEVETGREADAIPHLEKSIRYLGAQDPFFRSRLEFTLARALWATSRDHMRALALAIAAEKQYEGNSAFRLQASEVDRWLERVGHPRVDPSGRRPPPRR